MKRIAFTLAEVLIVLGIIGIVAAMTIPTLIGKYQKMQVVTKLKKVYSVLNQAQKLAEVDFGDFETWDILPENEYYEKYLKNYFRVLKKCDTAEECQYTTNTGKFLNGAEASAYLFAGASFLTQDGNFCAYRTYTFDGKGNPMAINIIAVDLNGYQEPNVYGKDIFWFNRTKKGILPDGFDTNSSEINNNCSKKGTGDFCAAKIMQDGWQIKDDYPW